MENTLPLNNGPACGRCIPLPEQTSLHRRYAVRRVTGFDDCSITYDGFDYIAHQPVSIIEFFPQALAMRAMALGTVSPVNRESGALYFLGSEAFLSQYSAITQAIGSPNIISVFEAFFENGTAYAITERVEGVTLNEYLRIQGRLLTPGELSYLASALSDALLIIHSLNVLHHGIAGERILLGADGTVKLTGFCAAHETVRRGHDVVSDEPYTDIRALGQALYRAFTGVPAQADMHNAPPAVSGTLKALLEGMLTDRAALRFHSVFDLRYAANSLDIAQERPRVTAAQIDAFRARAIQPPPQATHAQQAEPDAKPMPDRRPPRRVKQARNLLIGICALLAILVATLLVFLIKR